MANPSANRLPFSHRAEFVVRKPFKFGGVAYTHGDPFDPKRLAVDARRLRTMYDAKMVDMKGQDDQPDEPVVETVETPAALVAEEGQFIYDPSLHTVEHDDNEYWVSDAEAYLVRVRAPAAKNLDVATEPTLVVADDILAWGEED